MRANKIEPYRSILQVLDMPGCPICRFIKNYQSLLVQQKTTLVIHHLCNFHMWAVAATQRTLTVANLFQTLLSNVDKFEIHSDCDVCIALRLEEELRIKEFVSQIDTLHIARWLRSNSAFCVMHAAELERLTSPKTAASITATMRVYRDQLGKQLSNLRANDDPESAKWGVLGHVAEFLVSQRGLRP